MNEIHLNKALRNCLEAIHTFVFVNKFGIIEYINQNYCDLLGIKKEDAIGRNVEDIIPGTRLDVVVKTGKEEVGEIMKFFNHKTQKDIYLVANRIPVIENRQVIGAIGQTTIQDVSLVERLSEEIESLKNKKEYYEEQLNELRQKKYSLSSIIGKSRSIVELKKVITDISDSSLSVLITGETGTGKEVFANTIHRLSSRHDKNFVKINCAAIPKDLLESELFGYEEGAFTGASKKGKIGKFELANNGTLLLDEIGEMPLFLQSKLLRVLQEKEVERVGGTKPIKLNVRIICSTNKDIQELIQKGVFRADLYYRINIVELEIPPLRERLDDIPFLCEHFINKINDEENLNITGIEGNVLEMFKMYSWKGNVRELEHVLERACVMASHGQLKEKDFKFLISRINVEKNSFDEDAIGLLESTKNRSEKEEIIRILIKTNGNKSLTAKILNISRSTLYEKIKSTISKHKIIET
ncbi:PAS domain-containing protein [Clostridium bovifaecis]|uniref:PAS domain-containing protein n=1 Tax=Clostridium bovifaecis TaxID=2184719 RepID=A0A6I6ELD9_9CLOT|nr:PAS domain-containing protein [Clostridium bovifaecis]